MYLTVPGGTEVQGVPAHLTFLFFLTLKCDVLYILPCILFSSTEGYFIVKYNEDWGWGRQANDHIVFH